MKTPVSFFDYHLPPEQIAQHSLEPRDHSRLLVLDRQTGETMHRHFYDIVDVLQAGDVLVFNVSKVFRARLPIGDFERMDLTRQNRTQGELFVLKIRSNVIEALLRPGKKYPIGSEITIGDHIFTVEKKDPDGVCILRTNLSVEEMFAVCEKYGKIPTPPYIEEKIGQDEQYQTVYAKETGSVAAPTAGFHFTPQLLKKLKNKGIQMEEVILHVGIGTFRPVQVEHIEDHVMHEEWVELKADAAGRIMQAKREGRRVIAVGTTTTRVLEGIAVGTSQAGGGHLLMAYTGPLNIFITPGFSFRVIDGLITNFHLPKSTLLMLVSAFAGRGHVLAAYDEAVDKGYRFFSFGDAMFIR